MKESNSNILINNLKKISFVILLSSVSFLFSCTTLPIGEHKDYEFPRDKAFLGTPSREFKKIGPVRSKVNFSILDPEFNTEKLCKNYYHKAVQDLVRYAEKAGADAVIEVESVVFYRDGNLEAFQTPECSEDEDEGQILARGIAVKWVSKSKDQ